MQINKFLSAVREANGVTLQQVASSMKSTEDLVQSIEQGLNKVPEGMFAGYAHLLNVNVSELMAMFDHIRCISPTHESSIVFDKLVNHIKKKETEGV